MSMSMFVPVLQDDVAHGKTSVTAGNVLYPGKLLCKWCIFTFVRHCLAHSLSHDAPCARYYSVDSYYMGITDSGPCSGVEQPVPDWDSGMLDSFAALVGIR